MTGHLTDRDERAWQRRAEERVAEPLRIGAWIHGLGSVMARRRETRRRETRPRETRRWTAAVPSRQHPCGQV
ncbi:hypothetical protein AB0D99_03220 [Streptomyces sp. NPDC047971]|uniref:hypothetical protein n=1 Tax=Streptomyces sp. NPDC047971 TaxID=3154499 RepID=UPI0033F71B22